MKRLSIIGSYFLILSMLFTCKGDPCEEIECQNGGICLEGTCQCPEGFIGPECNIVLDPCIIKACDPTGTKECISNQNGEARCICKEGYGGDVCEYTWESTYTGNYTKTEECDGKLTTFPIAIEEGPSPRQITIVNFSNRAGSSTTSKIVANLLSSEVMDMYDQFMVYGKVGGSGSRNQEGKITLSYTIDTLQCSAFLERK